MPSTTIKTKGNRRVINFKNNGDSEWNDVIHERVFDLENNNYSFTLEPQTKYWRFGLRLFKSREIPFSNTSRHINEGNIDIQIAVGTWYKPENYWENGNRIELGQYNLTSIDHVIDRFENYESSSTVDFSVDIDRDATLHLVYKTGEHGVSKNIHLPPEFRYFKIFAWADMIAFDLDCSISRNSFKVEANQTIFRVENVIFKKSDLFDDDILYESDLIVLPCSSTGSIQPATTEAARQFNIPLPVPGEAGMLEIVESENQNGPRFWGWAYSVNDEQKSNAGIISQILNKLLIDANWKNIKSISLPLLGTGAGNLDVVEVADLYCEVLNSSKANLQITIAINNDQLFARLIEHFKTRTDLSNNIIASLSNRFIFRDKENVDPVLNVKDIAEEFSEIIEGIPGSENEGMVGIFGKWGRGKSYLIKEIWKLFEKQAHVIRIDFHAWRYQDTPAIWGYLFEQFAFKYYSSSKNVFYKIWRRLVLNFNRIGVWLLIYFLIPLSGSICWSFFVSGKQKVLLFLFSPLLSLIIIFYRYGKSAKSLFREYTRQVSFVKLLGIQAEVQKELKCLIKTWSVWFNMKKIILFVEDIDRCSEQKIIEIIDALRVLLEEKEISNRVIVVTAIDEVILKRAIKHKYSKLLSDEKNLDSIITEYLDKLFIVGLRLGQLSQREKDEYFIELTKEDRDVFDVPPFIFDEVVRERPVAIRTRPEKNKLNVSTDKDNLEEEKGRKSEKTKKSQRNEINTVAETKKYEKIQAREFDILRSNLLEYNSITPRQIRIFYYRYIIAKNLLERVYAKKDLFNIWASEFYSKIFIQLLMRVSEEGGREILDNHKLEILHSTAPYQKVYRSDATIDTLDYRELLKVLDVVIAY